MGYDGKPADMPSADAVSSPFWEVGAQDDPLSTLSDLNEVDMLEESEYADGSPGPELFTVSPQRGVRRKRFLVLSCVLAGMSLGAGVVWVFAASGHLLAAPPSREGLTNTIGTSNILTELPNSTPVNPAIVSNTLVVDVQGDVLHPGIVRVSPDARVQDVIQAAGGFLHSQDQALVNLAAPVNDGDEIIVPGPSGEGNELESSSSTGNTSGASGNVTKATAKAPTTDPAQNGAIVRGNLIDLNTADAASLETIPGIGPSKAQAIIQYRQEHGRFTTISDLRHIHGIGPVTMSRITPYVTIVQER